MELEKDGRKKRGREEKEEGMSKGRKEGMVEARKGKEEEGKYEGRMYKGTKEGKERG